MRVHNMLVGGMVFSTALFSSYFRTSSVGEVVDIPQTFEQRWQMNIPINVTCRAGALSCGWLWLGTKNLERLHVYRDLTQFERRILDRTD